MIAVDKLKALARRLFVSISTVGYIVTAIEFAIDSAEFKRRQGTYGVEQLQKFIDSL